MPPPPKRGRENDAISSTAQDGSKGHRAERAIVSGGAARPLGGISTNGATMRPNSLALELSVNTSSRRGVTPNTSTRGQPSPLAIATAAAADATHRAMLDTLQCRRRALQEKSNALEMLMTTTGPDAIEAMVDGHAEERAAIRDAPDPLDTDDAIAALEATQCGTAAAIVSAQEERARLYSALTECEEVTTVAASEDLVLANDALEGLLPALHAAQADKDRWDAILRERAAELALEQDSTYGLTAEAAALIKESERLHAHRAKLEKAAAATEMERRLAHATYEELKGTIRVYCRVKGGAGTPPAAACTSSRSVPDVAVASEQPSSIAAAMHAEATAAAHNDAGIDDTVNSTSMPDSSHMLLGEAVGRASSSSSSRSSTSTTSRVLHATAAKKGFVPLASPSSTHVAPSSSHEQQLARFTFPDGSSDKRMIGVVSSRDNATSTGVRNTVVTNQYDCVFPPNATQQDVFDEVGPLVDCAVDGYRVCILAYGQTGSGKTFTMEGDVRSPEQMGIIPRSVRRMFDRRAALSKDGWNVRFTCYFVEIYNEGIRDLLETSDSYHKSFFAQDGGGGHTAVKHDIAHKGKVDTTITNVKERVVNSVDDVQQIIELSLRNRSVARTALNERSSRSHCVFTIRIEGTHDELRQRSLGNLCLVDLAGSERVHDSGVQGVHLKESVNINKSLSFLGDCIGALSSGAVVPWRNCKLTWLLQNYLGGDGAKVLMLVTVSDREEHVNETICKGQPDSDCIGPEAGSCLPMRRWLAHGGGLVHTYW